MLLQSFPQVVRIGFGDPAPFAVLSGRDRRELLCTAGEDIAVAFLQIFVLIPGQALRLAFGDNGAGFLEQALHMGRPGIVIGVDDEGELAQQNAVTTKMQADMAKEAQQEAADSQFLRRNYRASTGRTW